MKMKLQRRSRGGRTCVGGRRPRRRSGVGPPADLVPGGPSGCAASTAAGRPSRPWTTAAGRGGPSVPAVDAARRRGRLRGTKWGRGERQPVVERPELPGPRRSSRRGRNPSVSGSGPMTRLIDASATGAREGPGGGGGYPVRIRALPERSNGPADCNCWAAREVLATRRDSPAD